MVSAKERAELAIKLTDEDYDNDPNSGKMEYEAHLEHRVAEQIAQAELEARLGAYEDAAQLLETNADGTKCYPCDCCGEIPQELGPQRIRERMEKVCR